VPVIGPLLIPKPGEKRGYGPVLGSVFGIVDERWALPVEKRRQGSDMLGEWIRQGLTHQDLREFGSFLLTVNETQSQQQLTAVPTHARHRVRIADHRWGRHNGVGSSKLSSARSCEFGLSPSLSPPVSYFPQIHFHQTRNSI